ncbi:arabinogalactan oligomer/maltooligosaccharide transport system permease protein [Deinobacterium chartae]|uniref:Arabinogalactan oligomer/maltooligosaccharide transport system permease protein n=1 Tax=Deinobacterium chartae TaxID=521158 RepID=A0A841HXV2_9DEIO|nr:sugar ABC transporter permease [Deinobacterium chartae]MBB6097059.1 arabinogalactan oligomer/maltooligosaccharide transport system permease protein [Deinobacterium chartae]
MSQVHKSHSAPEYRPKQPNLLQRALPWLIAMALVAFLVWFFGNLISRVQPGGLILRVENGWIYLLLGIAGVVVLIALTSLLTQLVLRARRGRAVNFWPIFGNQLTHVTLWAVIVAAVYPIFYVIAASFDPRSSLFSLARPQSDNILISSKVLPSFEVVSWANYAKLFEGITLPMWQLLLLGVIAVSLLVIGVSALIHRLGGTPQEGRGAANWAMRIMLVAIGLIVVFMGPAQFTGDSNEAKFLLNVRNTFLVSGLTGLIAILLSTTAGYAIARLRFPGRHQTLLFFIFVQMFPGFLALVAIFYLLVSLGLLNTFTGLILAYSAGAIAFNTWIYKGYVESLPLSLEEAALVDGATRWQAFTRVVLPLSGPILAFMFLNQFIGTYAEFIVSSIVLTGVDTWTVGVALRNFTTGQFSTQWGTFAAASVVGAIPIVLLFYGFQQYFVGGAAAGGVKE